MTEQHALYEPSWVDEWQPGDRCVSVYTGNAGVVCEVMPGRCIWVAWQPTSRDPKGYKARCSSPSDIIREGEA